MRKIAFVSDIHLNEDFPLINHVNTKDNWLRIIEDIKSKNIQEIIFGGDIGDKTAHKWFFETLKPFSLKIILGNHDEYNQVANYYTVGNDKNELFYQFEDDYYKYIFLDTSSDEISNKQINWLKMEIESVKKIIIFIHHPVIQVDTPIDKMYPLKNRDELEKILKAKEIVLFCGHYHMNHEITLDRFRQIITHSSSYQLIKNADEIVIDNSIFGYRIIELNKGDINTEIVNIKGN